jgi:hypothetical protein
MAFDQSVTYRVNLDDSNFQAKLTQMRASLDSTVGGGGGFGQAMAYLGTGAGNFGMGGGNPFAGGGIGPVAYTPPAIAFQPHFGMFQVQQTLSQAGLSAAFGPMGVSLNQLRTYGLTAGKDFVPPNMSWSEYIDYSTRSVGSNISASVTAMGGAALGVAGNLAGGAAGAGIGTMMGGTVGGLVGGVLGGSAFGAVASSVAERAAANLGMQATLSAGSFRYYQGANADPITGRGFGRSDRFGIASSISRMESNDARLNLSDYRQILEGGSQMGLFEGTKDVKDFETKFKSLVETVKTVTSTLHTSLKDGLATIRGLRDMGISDPISQQQVILGSEVMGRASGRTGMEMMAVGQAGAEIFRGTGISMQRGFQLNQQNAALVRNMLNNGTISRDSVEQAGGELGLAQQMTANSLGSFQTMQGRLGMMSFFNSKSGEFDPNMVSKMMTGSPMNYMQNAAALGPAGMAKLQANQAELIGKMSPEQMQFFGMAQRMGTARMLQQNWGGDLKDWYKTTSYNQNISHSVVDAEIGMMSSSPETLRSQYNMQLDRMGQQQNMEGMRESSPYAYKYWTNYATRAVDAMSRPVAAMGNAAGQTFEDLAVGFRNTVFGEQDQRLIGATAITNARSITQQRINDRVRRAASSGVSGSKLKELSLRIANEEYGTGTLTTMSDETASIYKMSALETGGGTQTINGIAFTEVDSPAQAAEAAKNLGVSASGFSANGKYYYTTNANKLDAIKTAHSYLADPEALKKFSSSVGSMTFREKSEFIDKWGTGPQAALRAATGGRVSDFGKGALSEQEAIAAQHFAEQMGTGASYVESANGAKAAAEINAGAQQLLGNDLTKLQKNIDNIMGNNYGSGFINNLTRSKLGEKLRSGDANAIEALRLVQSGMSKERLMERKEIAGLSKEDVDQIMNLKENHKIDALINNVDAASFKLSNAAQQGQSEGGVGAFNVATSKTAMEAMKKMADQLEQQIKILETFRTQFADKLK